MTLWDEVHEQPTTLSRLIDGHRSSAVEIASWIKDANPSSVLIAARGTSDNAARYALYVWGARNRFNVALAAPSLFSVYDTPPRLDGALVVGISQSGESPDLVAVLEEARTQGRPTLAITNHPDSPLARIADKCLELHTGQERAVAATKTYTAQIAAVASLSGALTGDTDHVDSIPGAVEQVLAGGDLIARAASQFTDMDAAAVLGRGFNHSTAFEWALKLQELTYVLAHPYSTADFIHGPLAVVSRGFPILAVDPIGSPHQGVTELLRRLTDELGSRLVLISNDEDALGLADAPIPIPAVPEWLSPIPAIVAGQLFTWHLAKAKGLDPDSPRSIQKVTRTT